MAGEHEHSGLRENDREGCALCNQTERERALEQELAQARALLEGLLTCVPLPTSYSCPGCEGETVANEDWDSEDEKSEPLLLVAHTPGCPIEQAYAFLAQHKGRAI